MPNNACSIRPTVHVEIDHYLSWLYIPDYRMLCIPARTVKVSIRNYTWTIRASVHLEIDHFFIMVIYTGFPYLLYFHVQ